MRSTDTAADRRDRATLAVAAQAGELGWWRAAREAGVDFLYPGGLPDLIDSYADLADRRMVVDATAAMTGKGLTGRVRALVAARFAAAEHERAAVRRAVAFLALPGNAALNARLLARTVDRVWHGAGDVSADFSWYTKRAILAAVYGATFLYWLRDSGGGEATLVFLDRRLGDVGRLGKLRARLNSKRTV